MNTNYINFGIKTNFTPDYEKIRNQVKQSDILFTDDGHRIAGIKICKEIKHTAEITYIGSRIEIPIAKQIAFENGKKIITDYSFSLKIIKDHVVGDLIFYSKTKSKKSGKNNINETLDSDIKGSDVIITDKQFYSVGLKFNMDTMDAPIINFLSDNIIEIESKAERFKIPEIINRPLAIELFNNHNVGEEIAVLYYSPVSKIYKEIWNKK